MLAPSLFIYTCWFSHTVQQTVQAFRVCVCVLGQKGLGACVLLLNRWRGDWYKQPPDAADSSITHSSPPSPFCGMWEGKALCPDMSDKQYKRFQTLTDLFMDFILTPH
ncbi:hypothetical protein CHARACLAT_007803 [Characodon lateralis]|uniref:Uncharacterized protein n=1 Tax=Characodon lateralis TaxID=208331 RepID=A0ABU7F115_9TELE|nr:hypothetical protein [Characodon lateralis]